MTNPHLGSDFNEFMDQQAKIDKFKDKAQKSIKVVRSGSVGFDADTFQPTISFTVTLGLELENDSNLLDEGHQIIKDVIYEKMIESCKPQG